MRGIYPTLATLVTVASLTTLSGCTEPDQCETQPAGEACSSTGISSASVGETQTSETSATSDSGETSAPGGAETASDSGTTPDDVCISNDDCGDYEICQDGSCRLVCDTREFVVEGQPPNVMLVLDKSGSMVNEDYNWDHDGDPQTADVTRWFSLHAVVESLLGMFDSDVNFGATLFPAMEAQAIAGQAGCVMSDAPEVAVLPEQGQTILATIPAANDLSLAGGTPAEQGLALAYAHLAALEDPGDPIAILVTDGAANCSTSAPDNQKHLFDENLYGTVEAAWEQAGIPTYVVGIDISDAPDLYGVVTSDVLNEAASRGGVPREGDEKFYNATNHQVLQQALTQILEQSISCTLELSQLEQNEYLDMVMIGDMPYPQLDPGADCDQETGWILDDTGLRLCGQACSDYRSGEKVEVVVECDVG